MSRAFRPGDRLDPASLAPGLASSVTPVRDALHVLVGEGLVETRTGGGFHLPALDEPALADLYDWSAELLGLAIRRWPAEAAGDGFGKPAPGGSDLAGRTDDLFLSVARRSANLEHARAVARLSVRLHAVRAIEPVVLGNGEDELLPWYDAIAAGRRQDLRRLVAIYHRRRRRMAAAIVRCVYRTD